MRAGRTVSRLLSGFSAGRAAAENDMKTYTRYILSLLFLSGTLLFLGGCRKSVLREGKPGLSPEDTALVDAVLILRCNDLQTKAADRETQERQMNDLNLFFVHKSYPSSAAPEVRHYYFSSADMARHIKLTNIRLGRYTMYAVANAGEQLCSDSHDPEHPAAVGEGLCSMTEAQIQALTVGYSHNPTQADNLLMSSVDPDMAVKRSDESVLPTITVSLERKVSKVDFSYDLVGPAVGNMEIYRVEAKSLPYQVSPFVANRPATGYYEDRTIVNYGSVPNKDAAYSTTFYMPENMQGDVEGVASEQDRNARKAPANASYLYLDGKYGGNQYGISVYFGESMTGGNFDLGGNTHYQLHLALGGPDVNDARVSSLKINSDDFKPSIRKGEETYATVEIICSNYFNDEITLMCAAVGGSFKKFRVRLLDEGGNEAGGDLDDYSGGECWYKVLTTDDSFGEKRIKCRVYYSQTVAPASVTMILKIQTRYGQSTFKTQDIQVTN